MATNTEKSKIGIAALCEAFPEMFNPMRPRPLALGIHTQIANARRAGTLTISVLVQRAALNAWLKRPNYHRAVAATANRYNLDGTVSSVISDDHRQHAIDELKMIRKAKKAKKSAIHRSKVGVAA